MMKQKLCIQVILFFSMWMILSVTANAQKNRAGTTTANFLEIGFGASGTAMGDAQVSMASDVSSIYWNPAGLARLERSEVLFASQPWIADMNTSFSAVGLVLPGIGTVGAGIILMDYGDMAVTTMNMQEGTGETFAPKDMAIYLSYARSIAEWFSVGLSGKLINSTIWHMTGTAIAFDLGVLIKTDFFSPTGDNVNGLNIGMSISNYGSGLKYDGLDLLYPIDVSSGEAGNYRDASGQFRVQEWQLPLLFRIGTSITPIKTEIHELILSADALHPNNNSESVNLGGQYSLSVTTIGKIFLRGGYKALFMDNSQYGLSFGFGLQTDMIFNTGLRAEYSYRDIGILGNVNSFGVSLQF